MTNLKFRRADISDVECLSILFQTVYIETYGVQGVSLEFTKFIQNQFSPEQIATEIASDGSELLISTYHGNPIGAVLVKYNNPCPLDQNYLRELNKLYVLRRFFGLGVGQHLMTEAIKTLEKRGSKDCWLWTLETNYRALDFYKKQGFKEIGKANFEMEENTYTNLVLTKKL